MTEKIIINMRMRCDKCRKKAMKIAAVTHGVNSIALEGEEKDQLVVIGEGIDSVCLTKVLRKKVDCKATISSVGKVKEEKKKEESCKLTDYYCPPPPLYPFYGPLVYEDSPNNCPFL